MTHLQRSSSGSPACRLEWQPSRWLLASVVSITLLAVLAVHASGMAWWLAWPLSGLVLWRGVRIFLKERARPVLTLLFPAGNQPVLMDGKAVGELAVQWRGPLAFMSWRGQDGVSRRLSWWPDTLPPTRRRELRLALDRIAASRGEPGMAP